MCKENVDSNFYYKFGRSNLFTYLRKKMKTTKYRVRTATDMDGTLPH